MYTLYIVQSPLNENHIRKGRKDFFLFKNCVSNHILAYVLSTDQIDNIIFQWQEIKFTLFTNFLVP